MSVCIAFVFLASLGAALAPGEPCVGAARDPAGSAEARTTATGVRVTPAGAAPVDVDLGAGALEVVWCAELGRFVAAAGSALWTVTRAGSARRIARLPGPARALSDVHDGLLAVALDAPRRAVAVYVVRRGRIRLAGGGVEGWRRPSRVSWGDVDGDGSVEALVLVTGRARFDQRLALRPFVYGWDGRRLYPKWLGSRLSRPFEDATLGDVDADGRAELVAVERTRDGQLELAAYRWRGFGFERVAVAPPASRVCRLAVDERGRITAVVDGTSSAYRLAAERIEPIAGADR
jgi:hypothetical protein